MAKIEGYCRDMRRLLRAYQVRRRNNDTRRRAALPQTLRFGQAGKLLHKTGKAAFEEATSAGGNMSGHIALGRNGWDA